LTEVPCVIFGPPCAYIDTVERDNTARCTDDRGPVEGKTAGRRTSPCIPPVVVPMASTTKAKWPRRRREVLLFCPIHDVEVHLSIFYDAGDCCRENEWT